MKTPWTTSCWLVRAGSVLAALFSAAAGMAVSAGDEETSFEASIIALTQDGHRLTGTNAGKRAGDFLSAELRRRGVTQVIEQDFVTLQNRTLACRMTNPASGRQWELSPARPNALMPSVTPPEGLRGVLVDARDPASRDMSWRDAIVVFRNNDTADWRRAFRLGARAVLFVGTGDNAAVLHLDAPVVAPRFFLPGDGSDLPWGQEVILESSVTWESVLGRNVIGLVKGSVGSETVVVSVARDSFGEIPEHTAGARRAANCAALLELVSEFTRLQPARNVAFCFFDGESRGLAGSTAFYAQVAAADANSDLADRKASIDRELAFLDSLDTQLADVPDFAMRGEVGRQLVRMLQALAAGELDKLQRKLGAIRRQSGMSPEVIAENAEQRKRWNEFRRALHANKVGPNHAREWQYAVEQLKIGQHLRRLELVQEQAAFAGDSALAAAWPTGDLVLHLSLELGDATDRWGLALGGDSVMHSLEDRPGLASRLQAALRASALGAQERGQGGQLFELASVDGRLPPGRAIWGAPKLVHAGESAGLYGIYNGVLATVQESLLREGSLNDTIERLDWRRLRAQVMDMAPVLRGVVSDDRLSVRRVIRPAVRRVASGYEGPNRSRGPQVWTRAVGAGVAQQPIPGAVIMIRPLPTDIQAEAAETRTRFPAYDDFRLAQSTRNGTYRILATTIKEGGDWAHAVVFDDRGWPRKSSNLESAKLAHARLQVFPAVHGWMFTGPARQAGTVRLVEARSNSPLDQRRSWSGRADDCLYWFHDESIAGLKIFGVETAVRLKAAKGQPVGATFQTGAEDLAELNRQRLELLKSHGIASVSVESLQRRSDEWLAKTGEQTERAGSEASAALAFWSAGPAYESLADTFNDLIVAVLLLLLLAIPFAFALERLVVGATNIYRQISWFAAFFIAAFAVLYLTHPAFALSSTPLIIFLGFTILLLSGSVIVILVRKFEHELKAARGQADALHSRDVSRFGALFAAMGLGLSTMRRRPLRTTLTAISVFFLTFCVLVFASFAQTLGVTRTYAEPLPTYAGLLVQRADLGPLPGHLAAMLSEQASGWKAIGRWWDAQDRLGGSTWLVTKPGGEVPVAMRGVLGLDPVEVAVRPDLAAVLGPINEESEPAWITTGLAARLGVVAGDRLLLAGRPLEVHRVLTRLDLASLRDIGGGSLLPVDFTSIDDVEKPSEKTAGLREPPKPQTPLSPDEIIVVKAATARAMGAPLRAVSLLGGSPASAPEVADDLAIALRMPVAATGADGTYWHFLAAVVQASGWRDLVIPVLLGGLVILGTMLGSVVDREKEIYTFSALGLAPNHIAGLFLAEAGVYAIIGGFAGYLGVQILGRILEILSDYGWVAGMEMNHSSLNAMVSLLVVIVTVLASAMYPALRASRSANPGLARRFALPPLKGDSMQIDFPFTVSAFDFSGVLAFLHEHFASLRDGSLGSFQTARVRCEQTDSGPLFSAEVAIKPYDLGVTQKVELESYPSKIPGVLEVRLRLMRLSGEPKNWWRLNQQFVQDIRQQFLLWRSLSEDRMDSYRRMLAGAGEENL